jgi:PAS domain S-box-containing protein
MKHDDPQKEIRQLREAEKAARAEVMELNEIFQTVTEGVIVIDTDFNVLRVNDAFLKLAGIGDRNVTGHKCFEIFPGMLCHTPGCPLVRIRSGVKRLEYEVEKHRNDGTVIPCVVTAKPYIGPDGEFLGIVEDLKDISRLKQAQQELQDSFDRMRKTMGGIIQAMSLTIEQRDPYTAGHQRRVAKLSRAIARQMGFSWEQIQGIRMAAAIHDLGKIHVPTELLSRPGKLTENELGIIQAHPRIGYEILKGIEFSWPIAQTVYQHHERLDGSGYPRGLSGEDILMEARIIAVADVVEAMASFRPYRVPPGIDAALEEIVRKKGILYDPLVVDACLTCFREKGFYFDGKKNDRP